MAETIYPAPYYPIYKAYKTIGGWVVRYLSDRYTMRNVDGGKVHKHRQNAYAKAKRLNEKMIIDAAEESARLYFEKHQEENLDDEALLAQALKEMHVFLEQAEGRQLSGKERMLYYETWQEEYLDIKSRWHFAEYLESKLRN